MKYRTLNQFKEIMESMENGNWTQASKECVQYGFYANDLLNSAEEYIGYYGIDVDYKDLVLLIELATNERNKND